MEIGIDHTWLFFKKPEAARRFPREFGLYWPIDLRSPKMQYKISYLFYKVRDFDFENEKRELASAISFSITPTPLIFLSQNERENHWPTLSSLTFILFISFSSKGLKFQTNPLPKHKLWILTCPPNPINYTHLQILWMKSKMFQTKYSSGNIIIPIFRMKASFLIIENPTKETWKMNIVDSNG